MAKFTIFLIVLALIVGMAGCAPAIEIRTWYDLDAVRDNLDDNYLLMNDLDSTTPGYGELAGPNANGGKGWQPIGTSDNEFTGTFDGQGYGIKDLFIDRPDESNVGLFGIVREGGVINNLGIVNITVTGDRYVGGLVGWNYEGDVSSSYSTGNVTGDRPVGGLVGENCRGTLSNSHSTGIVNGTEDVGGLVGYNWEGTVSESYSTGSVFCLLGGGGLVGGNAGTVSNSYSTGSVTRILRDGGLVLCRGAGLVGYNTDTVSNSFWDTETSGQDTSDGGTGKTTAEMQDIATFTDTETEGLDEPWDITAVAPGQTNPSHIWNIVDGETYPFLSWQSVS